MKRSILIVLLSVLTCFSCSNDDDDPRSDYPKNVDIRFSITSTDESRNSLIETLITNGVNQEGISDIDLESSSYSNIHLPYTKEYLNQTVKYSTHVSVTFTDNSEIESINDPFVPYTIEMKIIIDGETVANKETEIITWGDVNSISYDFQ